MTVCVRCKNRSLYERYLVIPSLINAILATRTALSVSLLFHPRVLGHHNKVLLNRPILDIVFFVVFWDQSSSALRCILHLNFRSILFRLPLMSDSSWVISLMVNRNESHAQDRINAHLSFRFCHSFPTQKLRKSTLRLKDIEKIFSNYKKMLVTL